jgi:hypothetical protein
MVEDTEAGMSAAMEAGDTMAEAMEADTMQAGIMVVDITAVAVMAAVIGGAGFTMVGLA